MDRQSTRPVLLSKVRSKYGRRDYKRFDNIASTHMRAGRGSIGKVEIDCRFMFTKSHWGVIGESKNPGGIIYLDLDISQPADCKLESATITVILTEDDGEEARIQHLSASPVQFTDHYGPKCVRGPESFVQTRKIQNCTPEVQLFGYGAGGLGINKEKVVQTRGRWDFSGSISSSTGESLWYNRLRWELKENSLEWQPTHSNLFHTAFALQHNATRFYMTVHVSGKLANRSDKIKNKLKFGEKGSKDQEIVTKIEWAEGYSCPLRLDEVARDLHDAMEDANMTKVPVEIPDALAASYHPAIANPVTPTLTVQPPPGNPQVPQKHPPRRPCREPRSPASTGGETSLMGNPVQHLPPLTLEELSKAATGFEYHPSRPLRPPPLSTSVPPAAGHEEISASSSSETLVNSVPTQVGEGDREPASDTCPKDWEQNTDKSKSKTGRGRVWLGVTAMLLYWLGKVGVLLSGLASVVAVPSTPTFETPKGKKRNKNKVKMIGIDGASECSRTKTSAMKLSYPVRGRPRGRRGQRPYLNVDVGRRKRQQWEDIESNSSN